MQGSPLGYRTWLAAIYLVATNLKGVSSMKLHRDLGIGQKSAWYLAHRIREAWKEVGDRFAGPVEADEAYIGGKRKNMPKSRREAMKGAGSLAGKTIVAGARDRRDQQGERGRGRGHGRLDASRASSRTGSSPTPRSTPTSTRPGSG